MWRKSRRFILWTLSIVIPAVIVVWSVMPVAYKPRPYERISDNYRREAVKSYEVFELDSKKYAIMLVRLKTGEKFPMFCQSTSAGISPIHQSVIVGPQPDTWEIMCEPDFALTMLKLSIKDQTLHMGNSRLARIAKPPALL
jgi:hypothetical protein